MINDVNVASMLKNKRLEEKLTVRQFAKLLECSPSYLSELETGTKRLSVSNEKLLMAISETLKLPIEKVKEQTIIDAEFYESTFLKNLTGNDQSLAAALYRAANDGTGDIQKSLQCFLQSKED